MSILTVSGVTKSFVTRKIFTDVSFKVEQGDKIGVVGINGCGKTTLFKIITREEDVDSGSVIRDRQSTFSYMTQHSDYTSQNSPMDEILELFRHFEETERELDDLNRRLELYPDAEWLDRQHKLTEKYITDGGMTYRSRCRATLLGLGFLEEELTLPLENLSGGQRTRVLLAKILLSGSDLLLLDEPTNHLDIKSTQWLEEFLSSYKGAVLLISHDRYFLDKVCGKIFEIENEILKEYVGNYTKFREQKKLDRLTVERDYERKQKEIRRIEGIIEQQRRFNRERNFITIKSKQKQIEHIEKTVTEPPRDPDELSFSFRACSETGKDALIVENAGKVYGQRTLFKDVNMLVKAGDRAFLTGPNGCGKTTLFRMITGEIAPTFGECRKGARVEYGYYDQNISGLDENKTIFDEVFDAFPKMTPGQVRSALGKFLFRGDEVFKEISKLSGGERARVELVKLMLRPTNFLLLDEPTNHLDIASKEALEDALSGYDGTMLIVSHDRYFIDKLATKIFDMEEPQKGQGSEVKTYNGGYQFYLDEFEKRKNILETAIAKTEKPNEYLMKKAEESEKRKRKTQTERLENAIKLAEDEKTALEESLLRDDVAGDYEKLLETTEKLNEIQKRIDKLFHEWSVLAETE